MSTRTRSTSTTALSGTKNSGKHARTKLLHLKLSSRRLRPNSQLSNLQALQLAVWPQGFPISRKHWVLLMQQMLLSILLLLLPRIVTRWAITWEGRLLQPSLAPKITFVILRTSFRKRSRRLLVYSSWSTACHRLILFRHVLMTLQKSRVNISLIKYPRWLLQMTRFLMEPIRFGPRFLSPSITVYQTVPMNSMH